MKLADDDAEEEEREEEREEAKAADALQLGTTEITIGSPPTRPASTIPPVPPVPLTPLGPPDDSTGGITTTEK